MNLINIFYKMSFWSLNTSNKLNEKSILKNNVGYIGLADKENYQERINKKGNTTFKQFETFLIKAKKGDTIYLYKNRVGFIAYGIYNGKITHYDSDANNLKAPGWSKNSYQGHIFVDKWILLDEPIKNDFPRRKTLYKLDDDIKWTDQVIFNKLSNYYI